MNPWDNLPKPFFVLAPMEAVTDVVFRHVVRKAGAPDLFFTEFANATGWTHAGDKAIAGRLIKTDDEKPLIAQIWGGNPGDMEAFAKHCASLGFDGIDINMGCPAKSAIKSGGAALIRNPELAAESIAAAKKAGLPVSVKTRLGYTHVDEWRDWLEHLMRQDIVNLTIHLRTKKEMSKVPAHFELIPEIIKLRDDISPQTLLTINGDVRDRKHGLELVQQHPGINGIMIGRGVFHDPFCFADHDTGENDLPVEHSKAAISIASRVPSENNPGPAEPAQIFSDGTTRSSLTTEEDLVDNTKKQALLHLLNYHLDLFDKWQPKLGRPYETLKRFYKIYVRDFDGAAEVRGALMNTKSTDEARKIINN